MEPCCSTCCCCYLGAECRYIEGLQRELGPQSRKEDADSRVKVIAAREQRHENCKMSLHSPREGLRKHLPVSAKAICRICSRNPTGLSIVSASWLISWSCARSNPAPTDSARWSALPHGSLGGDMLLVAEDATARRVWTSFTAPLSGWDRFGKSEDTTGS